MAVLSNFSPQWIREVFIKTKQNASMDFVQTFPDTKVANCFYQEFGYSISVEYILVMYRGQTYLSKAVNAPQK